LINQDYKLAPGINAAQLTVLSCKPMAKKFEYTTLAHRYTARFPVLTYVGTQANFWIIANILLITIIYLESRIFIRAYSLPVAVGFSTMLSMAILLGASYGVIVGLISYYMDQKILRNKPLGKIILFKILMSLGVLILTLSFVRYVLFDPLISSSLYMPDIDLDKRIWRSAFLLIVIYYFFMTLVISFVNQVNKKYGPGILLPLLLGRYRDPKEQDRIFMFMDLKSSTATAEKLGHLKYSAFIRDCFADINQVLYPFRAQVYQYVGDEIVLTWPESEGLKNHFCIAFYFACKRQFDNRKQHYLTSYGTLPDFKAGAHTGTVTAVEIGEFKRDIAYHGDTLNTASRIQGVCNEYNRSFLASKFLVDKVGTHPNMKIEDLSMIQLKGKTTKVGVVSIAWEENFEPALS
jgi:adenylate cyclase